MNRVLAVLAFLLLFTACGPDLPEEPSRVATLKSNHAGECLTSEPTK